MKVIWKYLGKTKIILLLLLALLISQISCGCNYNKTSKADASFEVTKKPELSTPEMPSASPIELIEAGDKTDFQAIFDALRTAGYSETASTDAEHFLNAWKEAKNRKHKAPALIEVLQRPSCVDEN